MHKLNNELIEEFERKEGVESIEAWHDRFEGWNLNFFCTGGGSVHTRGVIIRKHNDLREALEEGYAEVVASLPGWLEEEEKEQDAKQRWEESVQKMVGDNRIGFTHIKTSKRGLYRALMLMGDIKGMGERFVPTKEEAIKEAYGKCLASITRMKETLKHLGEVIE